MDKGNMVATDTHTCGRCGEAKARSEFYVDKTKTSGLRSYCKVCQKAYNTTPEELANKQARKKVSRIKDPRRMLLAAAKNRAKVEGVPFGLALHNVFIPSHCPVFGTPFEIGNKYKTDNSPTLDRINPRLGYIVGNVAVISWKANNIKRDATLEELEKLLSFMISYDRVDQFITDQPGKVVKVFLNSKVEA